MTSLVGILCKDGVVIGADSAVSFTSSQFPTIEQPYDKIDIFGDEIIVVGTGSVGLGQRFCQIVSDSYQTKKFQQRTPIDVGKVLSASTVNDFSSTGVKQGQYAALVAFPLNGKANLIEFDGINFQPELKTEKLWFTSLGCVQTITDSFLAFLKSIFWMNEIPNLSDGIFAVKWTLDHAVEVNPGGVNKPVCLAILQRENGRFIARRINEEELEEHQQNIQDAKKALVEFRNQHKDEATLVVPIVQKPENSKTSINTQVSNSSLIVSPENERNGDGSTINESQIQIESKPLEKQKKRHHH